MFQPKGAPVRFLALLVASTLIFLLAACGDEGEGGDLNVTLNEYTIEIDPASLEEGPITIDIKNEGQEEHELLIVRTNIAAAELPTKDDGSLDEDAAGVNVEKRIEEIEDGDETSRVYTLDPGSYVLVDNIVTDIDGAETSFFAEGMWVEFTVTEKE
jgi:tetrahydromethanopterin S-methyltransferase subunit A